MNTKKSKRVIRIDFDTRTPEQKSDQELAAQVAKTQDFPYDHTCSYDKVRPRDCGHHEAEHLFEPSVEEIRDHLDKIPHGNIGADHFVDGLRNEIDETKLSSNKHHLVEDAKKDVLACRNGINEIRKALGEFEPATRETWNEFMNRKINNTFPNPELARAYHAYKDQVEQFIKDHPKFPSYIAKGVLLDEYPEDKTTVENDEPERPFGEKVFKEYTDRMLNTYIKKNSDYGSSFDELFDEYGMDSVLIRLKDKYNRLKSLTKPGQKQMVLDESMEDTLLDLANYCILTLVKIRKNKSQEKVSE